MERLLQRKMYKNNDSYIKSDLIAHNAKEKEKFNTDGSPIPKNDHFFRKA